jgi:hypothetical protein
VHRYGLYDQLVPRASNASLTCGLCLLPLRLRLDSFEPLELNGNVPHDVASTYHIGLRHVAVQGTP